LAVGRDISAPVGVTALRLTPEAVRESERQMMQLAVATGIRYHGWKVTLNVAEERPLRLVRGLDK
jgi:cytosine/adenosine deaminase-related metal-dependent hydrolase